MCIKIINNLLLHHLSLSNPYSIFLLFLISSSSCLNHLVLGRNIGRNSFNFNCNSLPDSFILSIFFPRGPENSLFKDFCCPIYSVQTNVDIAVP